MLWSIGVLIIMSCAIAAVISMRWLKVRPAMKLALYLFIVGFIIALANIWNHFFFYKGF